MPDADRESLLNLPLRPRGYRVGTGRRANGRRKEYGMREEVRDTRGYMGWGRGCGVGERRDRRGETGYGMREDPSQ